MRRRLFGMLLRAWLVIPCGAAWRLDGRWRWQRRMGEWWLPRYIGFGYWLEDEAA